MSEIFDKIKSFSTGLKNVLLGDAESAPSGSNTTNLRQQLLDFIYDGFKDSMKQETTSESLLFHCYFSVYMREDKYDVLKHSFPITAKDCVKKFNRDIISWKIKYPDYIPHTHFWTFIINVVRPDTSMPNGSDDDMVLVSSLYDLHSERNNNDDGDAVVTVRTQNTGQILYGALNRDIMKGIAKVNHDMYKIDFNLDTVEPEAVKTIKTNRESVKHAGNAVATLHADMDKFIVGGMQTRNYSMHDGVLYVCGKNGDSSLTDGAQLIVDNDSIMSPHIKIERRPDGTFTLTSFGGTVILNEEAVPKDCKTPVPLPDKSNILIDLKVQIKFTVLR